MELHRKLGLLEAVGLSIALIAPTMGMAFNVSLAAQVAGPAAPLSFLIGTGVVLVVALSFAAWCRRLSHAGSAYGFITEAFGSRWGFMAGWALLLSYICYGAGASALVGSFVQAAARTSGWQAPRLWISFSVASILASTFLARRNMQLAGRAMVALQGVSMLAIFTLALLILKKLAGQHALSFRPFTPSPAYRGWAGVGYGIVFTVLSFAGFEGAATLGEETNHPRRNVPIALIGTLLVSGALFVFVSYAQVLGYGLNNIQALAADSAPLDTLAVRYASRGYAVALDVAAALGSFACVLASLSAAGRMLFALGRAGLAPVRGPHSSPSRHARQRHPDHGYSLLVWSARMGTPDRSGLLLRRYGNHRHPQHHSCLHGCGFRPDEKCRQAMARVRRGGRHTRGRASLMAALQQRLPHTRVPGEPLAHRPADLACLGRLPASRPAGVSPHAIT